MKKMPSKVAQNWLPKLFFIHWLGCPNCPKTEIPYHYKQDWVFRPKFLVFQKPNNSLLCLLCLAKINFKYTSTKYTTFHNQAFVAQLVERVALNLMGLGSNPGGGKFFFYK